MRRRAAYHEEEAEIDLTPLIDVVFVILTMFIVVAPLLEMDRVELAQGTQHELLSDVRDISPITIYVYGDNTLSFNKQPISLTQLPAHLRLAKRHHPAARPQLFHDRKATFGTYQTVKQAVEGAGFSEMDILLQPE